VVKVPDYNAERRGLETLPSEIYLFKKFLAADSSGCLFCHTWWSSRGFGTSAVVKNYLVVTRRKYRLEGAALAGSQVPVEVPMARS